MKSKRKLLDALSKLPRSSLIGASFSFRWQCRKLIAVEEIKNRLRLAGVKDKRIIEIVHEASKRAVTSFVPFLEWLDVLATEEIGQSCKANSSK